jgi:hypothetical protein
MSFQVALGLAGHPSALPRFGKRRVIWLLCDWSMLFAPTTFPFFDGEAALVSIDDDVNAKRRVGSQ